MNEKNETPIGEVGANMDVSISEDLLCEDTPTKGLSQISAQEYLTSFLSEFVGMSIEGLGGEDRRMSSFVQAKMGLLFERYVTGKDGDNIEKNVLVDEGGRIFIFNGRYFEKSTFDTLHYCVKQAMIDNNVGEVYIYNAPEKIAKECYNALQQVHDCKFNPQRKYIIFKNCVLNIETDEIFENGHFLSDMVLDFDYYPDKRFPFWEEFVQKTVPDAEMRTALQQFCGAFLMDRQKTKIEYICLLVGTGRNGKSVLAQSIINIFPENIVSQYSPEQLFKSSQSMYYLADINGKIANYCDDISEKDFSGGDFKSFTSGAKFKGRHPYGKPFTVTKIPLMLCCSNRIPASKDDTDGYYRRILPIICPNKVADNEVDTSLEHKLSTDEARLGIFNWILEGYRQLIANDGKIKLGQAIEEAKKTYRENTDPVANYVAENGYTPDSTKKTPLKEVFASFKKWQKDMGQKSSIDYTVFRERLVSLGFSVQKSTNNRSHVYWRITEITAENST